jgi:hypothetical protein
MNAPFSFSNLILFCINSFFFHLYVDTAATLWFTLCSGLDFACRPFRFPFTRDILSDLPKRVRSLLRLRQLQRKSYRMDLNHLDHVTAGHTKKRITITVTLKFEKTPFYFRGCTKLLFKFLPSFLCFVLLNVQNDTYQVKYQHVF